MLVRDGGREEEGDEEGATEGVGGATQPTRGEALEHGSSYQCEATHVSTVSPTLNLLRERERRGGYIIELVSYMIVYVY